MQNVITIAQIVTATLLTGSILLQARGTGLSTTFGGDGNVYRTKRGVEKILFHSTIVLAVAFFGLAIATVVVNAA
jgi:preprotein translocase subunit SecG